MPEERSTGAVWQETVRTASLIRMYRPMLDEVELKIMADELTGKDAEALGEVVSDALTLVSLVEELDRRGAFR